MKAGEHKGQKAVITTILMRTIIFMQINDISTILKFKQEIYNHFEYPDMAVHSLDANLSEDIIQHICQQSQLAVRCH